MDYFGIRMKIQAEKSEKELRQKFDEVYIKLLKLCYDMNDFVGMRNLSETYKNYKLNTDKNR